MYFNPLIISAFALIALNSINLTIGIMFEGRIKFNALRYLVLYVSAMPSALRGDCTALLNAMCIPCM